jgi:hypothetical protein
MFDSQKMINTDAGIISFLGFLKKEKKKYSWREENKFFFHPDF